MDDAERDDLLRRFDREFSTDRRGRLRVRNPAQPHGLLGLLVGAVYTTGIVLTDRGDFLTVGLLQIGLAQLSPSASVRSSATCSSISWPVAATSPP